MKRKAPVKPYIRKNHLTNYIPQSDYTDTPPKELLKPWAAELEPKPTLDNTAFYAEDEDGETYLDCGGSRLKVHEHFADAGKPVGSLIERVIDYTAQ